MNLQAQSRQVCNLINRARDLLMRPDTIQYFRNRPELEQVLLNDSSNLKTYPLILMGLKEKIGSTVLPSREELSQRETDWLEVGDCVVGWQGFLCDDPRVVTEVTEEGYKWRYATEDEGVSRGPVALDKWLQSPGWVKVPDSALEAIEAFQQAEIDALLEKIAWFESGAFLITE